MTPAAAGPARTAAAMIQAAEDLAPLLADRARSAEIARQPDDEVIAAAAAAGIFDLMAPVAHGGAELDLDTFFEVGLRLGEADASAAWVICFYVEHVWMLCQFPAAFQAELFAHSPHVLAPAMLSPTGRATPVDGGFRLDGRWQWGTGIVHAEWVIVGALAGADEEIRPMFLALPRADVEVEDTWHVDGMCGTGSHDVAVHDRFVPTHRCVDVGPLLNAAGPGAGAHDGPLYRTPMAPILSFAASLPVLGQARFVAREMARQLQDRYDMLTLEKQSDISTRQVRLARAHLDIRAAEASMRAILADVMAQRLAADEPTRIGWTAGIAHAVGLCRHAITELCEAAGAGSHFLANPLQRARRDVDTIACHVVFDLDQRYRPLGRSLLGLPSQSIWH